MTNADWICIPAEATFFDDLCECLKTSKERFDAGRYRKAANDLNQNLFHWMNECVLLYGRRVSSHSDTLRNVYPAVDDEDSGEETGSASGEVEGGRREGGDAPTTPDPSPRGVSTGSPPHSTP